MLRRTLVPDRSEGDINLGDQRRRWQGDHIGAAARAVLDADADAFIHQSLSTPCLNVLRGAHGIFLEDDAGRRIMDFHGNSAHQVGYGHPHVVEAVVRQLQSLPFCPRRYTHDGAVELADRLTALAPPALRDGKVLLAPSGAVAVGIALKLVRAATGRHRTLSMWGAFHGATLEASSVGGEALFRSGLGPLMPGAEHVPPFSPGDCVFRCGGRCSMACADYVERVLDAEGDVAAVIAEPIRCTTARVPPSDYWRRIRAACDRAGTLLIFDEIPTCLGRTGRWYASEHAGVDPDLLVLGKGLGGAVVPQAAVLARRALDVAPDKALGHYTHEKSPIGCAAALATLDVIEREALNERSEAMGARLVAGLRALRHPAIADVRGCGLLVGVELVLDGRPAVDLADRVMYESLSRGLSFKVGGGNVLVLTPPLTITPAQIDEAVGILGAALAAAAG